MDGEESPRHQSVRALHMEDVAASEELPVSIYPLSACSFLSLLRGSSLIEVEP